MEKIYVKRKEKTHTLDLSFFMNFNYKHVLCQNPTNLLLINCSPNSLLLQTFKTCFFCSFHNIPWFFSTKLRFSNLTTLFHLLFFLTIGSITLIHSFFSLTTRYQLHQNWFYKRTICMALPCSKRAKTFTSHVLDFFRFLCASKPICITYLSLPF
jgi:hypothetical protein